MVVNWGEKFNFFKILKESTDNPTVSIGETVEVFSLKQQTKQGNITILFGLELEALPSIESQEK